MQREIVKAIHTKWESCCATQYIPVYAPSVNAEVGGLVQCTFGFELSHFPLKDLPLKAMFYCPPGISSVEEKPMFPCAHVPIARYPTGFLAPGSLERCNFPSGGCHLLVIAAGTVAFQAPLQPRFHFSCVFLPYLPIIKAEQPVRASAKVYECQCCNIQLPTWNETIILNAWTFSHGFLDTVSVLARFCCFLLMWSCAVWNYAVRSTEYGLSSRYLQDCVETKLWNSLPFLHFFSQMPFPPPLFLMCAFTKTGSVLSLIVLF